MRMDAAMQDGDNECWVSAAAAAAAASCIIFYRRHIAVLQSDQRAYRR